MRQGDNLSPVLFSLFVNDLEDHYLADRVDGVQVEFATDDIFTSCFMLMIL